MELKILSFIGFILLFSFHCALSQPRVIETPNSRGRYFLPGQRQTKIIIKRNSPITVNVNSVSLPENYTVFSGCDLGFNTAYRFYSTKKSWLAAHRSCFLEGGYLAYPECANEERVYLDIIRHAHNGGAWIGFHDMYEEGKWTTVLGEPMSELNYVNWAKNEPNNYGPDGEDCAELYVNGMWYDMKCWKELFYFCKVDLF